MKAQLPNKRTSIFLSQLDELSCGKGWEKIILDLASKLDSLTESLRGDAFIRALQIKEKFGRLVIYWCMEDQEGLPVKNDTYDKAKELIEEAKEAACRVCEKCGSPSRELKATDGWIHFYCVDCYEEHQKASAWSASCGRS